MAPAAGVPDRELRRLRQQRWQPKHPRGCDSLERHYWRQGIPSTFVFFGYLTSSGGYVYGQVPTDNNIGGYIGTSATATQYFAIVNTGNGTSTPPFSMEQPAGFSATDKAGFFHDTFDPFYRDQEGAVPENTQVTLRFRTLHSSGIWGLTLRAYLFDTASGTTTGPVDTSMPFDQNITINGTEYDVWKTTCHAVHDNGLLLQVQDQPGTTNGWYSDDYLDDNDNVHKDGTGAASDGEPFPSFQITVYDPAFQTPAWLQDANVYHIMPDRFRNGDQTNDYCRTGSTTGCPTFYGSQQAFTMTSGTRRSAIRAIPAPDASANTATSSMAAICSAFKTNWTISNRWAWTPST